MPRHLSSNRRGDAPGGVAKAVCLERPARLCDRLRQCYSEIYFRDEPPLGSLEAAAQLGPADFKNLISFTSLSKRSNVPGMRSGFVAGDDAEFARDLHALYNVKVLPGAYPARKGPGGNLGAQRIVQFVTSKT